MIRRTPYRPDPGKIRIGHPLQQLTTQIRGKRPTPEPRNLWDGICIIVAGALPLWVWRARCGLAPHPPLCTSIRIALSPSVLCTLLHPLTHFVTPASPHAHARRPITVLAARPHHPLRCDVPRVSPPSPSHHLSTLPTYRSDSSDLLMRPSSTCGPTAPPMAACPFAPTTGSSSSSRSRRLAALCFTHRPPPITVDLPPSSGTWR
jgi:hypothetical protein